ncbi:MAG: M20/M25/M40 family metallo-hydrolase [Thermoleophilia bacterium]|nr:M20/M25/M40 family metallo-hydrolase [Thermoleophilia bacterium]
MGTSWDTPEHLQQLLCELVGWDSVTLTEGEVRFADKLAGKLRGIDYFCDRPELVALGAADRGRSYVTALYRHEDATDTIVLISHFDTVDTSEYGPLEPLAGDPIRLTEAMHQIRDELDAEAVADLESGEYLFGRGTMDMKMGLALHMALIEKAAAGSWSINLLLLSVPDEEVNSAGMRAAVSGLRDLEREHQLNFKLFLNGEPVFAARPGDTQHHIYTGTIGKIMPSALFYGRETHAGTPLAGLTSNYMSAYLTQAMEWNETFRETEHGESTQLPMTLTQRDIRDGYSTQTTYRTSALYNVFVMEQTAEQVMAKFELVARAAAERCMHDYHAVCERESVEPIGDIRVLRFEQLMDHAVAKLGRDGVDALVSNALSDADADLREQAMRVVDTLLVWCQELTPAIVLLFAPPYYPPVNTSSDELVTACVARVQAEAKRRFGLEIEQSHWFNGISDLSYVSYDDTTAGWQSYERNTPGYGTSYQIPFAAMQSLDAPVMNVGPFGKDPHKRAERLHIRNAFYEMPVLLEDLVKFIAGP